MSSISSLRYTTLPGVTARLRPTSNARSSVIVMRPLRASSARLRKPCTRLAPSVSDRALRALPDWSPGSSSAQSRRRIAASRTRAGASLLGQSARAPRARDRYSTRTGDTTGAATKNTAARARLGGEAAVAGGLLDHLRQRRAGASRATARQRPRDVALELARSVQRRRAGTLASAAR